MTIWSLSVHMVVWDLIDIRLNLYFVLNSVLLFCVLTCRTLVQAANLVYLRCVYCEENITIRNGSFLFR